MRPASAAAEGEAVGQAAPIQAQRPSGPPSMSATRMALAARATELARLDVTYLRHDLRNIGLIAGLMLAIVVGLSFVLK